MRTYDELVHQRRPPFFLAGLKLDFGPSVVFSDGRSALADGPYASRRVLFVTSDTCAFCRDIEREWCRAIAEVTLLATDELVFVTLQGSSIPDTLVACAKRVNTPANLVVARVRDVVGFGARTGILGTPTLLLIASDGSLVRSSSGGRGKGLIPLLGLGRAATGSPNATASDTKRRGQS
jgi:hypothetical protein